MKRALIVCSGNDLVADDAIGHEIYRLLSKGALPEWVRLCLLGVGGMDLLDELDGEDLLIVVDAVQFGSAPGTVHVLDWQRLPSQELRPVSGHGIGVKEALQVCRKLYPEKAAGSVYLVGVEGRCFNMVGVGLSPEVMDSLPEAVEKIVGLLG